VYDSNLQNIIN